MERMSRSSLHFSQMHACMHTQSPTVCPRTCVHVHKHTHNPDGIAMLSSKPTQTHKHARTDTHKAFDIDRQTDRLSVYSVAVVTTQIELLWNQVWSTPVGERRLTSCWLCGFLYWLRFSVVLCCSEHSKEYTGPAVMLAGVLNPFNAITNLYKTTNSKAHIFPFTVGDPKGWIFPYT